MAVSERQSFLDSAQTDPEIRREVLWLLEQSEGQGASVTLSNAVVSGHPQSRDEHSFGKFEITGSLGRGGMGEVFSAGDTELGRKVALKFVTLNTTKISKAAEGLLREAQTASALNHPNIVTIYEVFRSESSIAIVMELVEGRPVRELCKQPLPVHEAISIGRQIARALEAAHAQGIVHRDIKPENIMVRPDGCVKVLDFGLARQAAKLSGNFTAALPQGTLRYMSPEQVRCEPATGASDIYSLGLVLHELLTGHHPFPAESPVETARRILVDAPSGPLPREVPLGLKQLIESMRARDPSRRPNAGQVASQLDTLLDQSEKVTARKAMRRRYWTLAAASLCIVAAILWYGRDKPESAELADLILKPLTSQPGWEWAPAISPHGDAVAFTWTPTLDAPRQLYVKRDQDAEPLKLTASETEYTGFSAWSPDGKRIAFKREFEKGAAIFIIDSTGRGERKIVDLAYGDLTSSIDWSPDGRLLAFGDLLPKTEGEPSIYVYDLETGHKRQITTPPAGIWGDWSPKFSPDGKTLAFKRVTGLWADDIYFVSTGGGEVRRFTTLQRSIFEHTWMPDGKSLLLSCQCRGTVHGIWRFPLNAPAHPERVMQSNIETVSPTIGKQAGKIAWVSVLSNANIYRIAASDAAKPERLIASTGSNGNPAYAPDGRIAWTSDRSGSREIWIARQDGSEQKQITHLNGPAIGGLQWSFDGRHLAFDSRFQNRSDIFLLECSPGTLQCGEPRAMNLSPAHSPGFSADGRSIYFASDRSGRLQIWKRDLAGGTPVARTQTAATLPRESADGKWLYFLDRDSKYIARTPGSKGGAQPNQTTLLVDARKTPYDAWAVTDNEVVFVGRSAADRASSIRAYNLSTEKVRSVLNLTDVLISGDVALSVSRDGKFILFTQLDRSGSNIVIAEKGR